MLTIRELDDEVKAQKAEGTVSKEVDPMKYMVDDTFIEQVCILSTRSSFRFVCHERMHL